MIDLGLRRPVGWDVAQSTSFDERFACGAKRRLAFSGGERIATA